MQSIERRPALRGAAILSVVVLSACGISARTVEEQVSSGGRGGGQGHSFAASMSGTGGAASSTTGGGPFTPGGASFGTAGVGPGSGGKPAFGGATGSCDPKFLDYEPTCETPPEPKPGWCVPQPDNEGGASGETADPHGRFIDNLEDGDGLTDFVLGGRGAWFFSNDGSGDQYPTPCVIPTLVPFDGLLGQRYMRTYGAFFAQTPESFSNIGIALRSGPPACQSPLQVSDDYQGVAFRLGGEGLVRFSINTVATTPVADGGTCKTGCFDAHGIVLPLDGSTDGTPQRVYFNALKQEGWGTPAPFEPFQIFALQWSAKAPGGALSAGCFDFWVDTISFF